MFKKIILWTLGIIVAVPVLYFAFIIFVVGIVDASRGNCVQVSGVVEDIHLGGINDIVFKLKDNDDSYYINRGAENGLNVDSLKKNLTGKNIDLWHAKSWPLKGGHMAQLQYQDSIYYTEW